MTTTKILKYVIPIIAFFSFGCKKLIEADPPADTISTSQVFSDSTNAATAMAGIYSTLLLNPGSLNPLFSNGAITEIFGIYGDELQTNSSSGFYSFFTNSVLPTNSSVASLLWADVYKVIYQINASLEGIDNSSSLSKNVKTMFTGELKFLRAFSYFYLINFFGDVPYIGSTKYKETLSIPRTKTQTIYTFIERDLLESIESSREDYAYSNDDRVRVTKWAASALLARVYLYQSKWSEATLEASKTIMHSSLYAMCDSLTDVFKKNSTESILQLSINPSLPPYNITLEGFRMIPTGGSSPRYYLSNHIVDGFGSDDRRRVKWIDSTIYQSKKYFYPFKYQTRPPGIPNGSPKEFYTILRLAEQYLIRAEANARLGKFNEARADLNIIRRRAGLADIHPTNEIDLLNAILQEWQTEYFAEWGHRFFILKRMGKLDGVLELKKLNWKAHMKLLPIPSVEISSNSLLIQNEGYN